MLQMRCKTLQCPNFMIYLGDSEKPEYAESTRNRKIYNSCRKKHCWLRGLIPPSKKDMDYGHALIPRKKILSVVSMSVHFIYGKRDRRYPRLNHGWVSVLPEIQIDGAYLQFKLALYNETANECSQNPIPQLQSYVLVNTYSCFYHFFLCHIFYSPVNYITIRFRTTPTLLPLFSHSSHLCWYCLKLPCIIFAGQSKELNKWITVQIPKHNLKSQGWKHPKHDLALPKGCWFLPWHIDTGSESRPLAETWYLSDCVLPTQMFASILNFIWLVVYLPLWKMWVRQLGWLFPIYGKS